MMRRLFELDERHTRRLTIAGTPGTLRTLAVFFAHSGDSWFWLAGLAALWLLGSEFWKARALALAIAILLAAALVLGIKFSVKRRRPEGEWGSIYRNTDPHSFPSGHAARAALIAVLGLGFGPGWFGLLLLLWAPLVTLARVAMGVHYLSDVIAGVLFGILVGLLFLQFYPPIF